MTNTRAIGLAALIKTAMIAALACLLWACQVETESYAEGGIGGTGISQGPINGFGSIIVNGVHFDVESAEIYVGDEQVPEETLRHGMVVRVYGEMDEDLQNGVATRVEFDYDLVANISEVAADGQSFVAQGQTVVMDELTVIEGMDIEVGRGVYVSGLATTNGQWLARYIGVVDAQAPLGEVAGSGGSSADSSVSGDFGDLETVDGAMPLSVVELSGKVSNFDINAKRFVLGEQTIDYSLAVFFGDEEQRLQDGTRLWLEGHVDGDLVQAAQIKLLPTPELTNRISLFGGVITAVISEQLFEMRGVLVQINDATRFEYGDVSNLQVGSVITVRGHADESGQLVAETVAIKPSLPTFIKGPVVSVSGNMLTLSGIEMKVENTTLMLDNSSAALRRFSISNISTGDMLRVYGNYQDQVLVLTRLERVNNF